MKSFVISTLLLSLFLQVGCTDMEDLASASFPIEGKVLPWAQGGTGAVSQCQSKVIEVVGFNRDGTLATKPVGKTVAIHPDGSYRVLVATSSIQFQGSSQLEWMIRTRGCEENLMRPLTGFLNQDFGYGLLIMNRAQDLPATQRGSLNGMTVDQATKMVAGLDLLPGNTSKQIYDQVLANASLKADVERALGIVFEHLPTVGPAITVVSAPTSVNELQNMVIQTQASHWYYDDSYFIKEWRFQGQPHAETSSAITVPTTKNSLANYAFNLRIGHPNSSGGIDTNLNTDARAFGIAVNNTHPATLPPISLISATPTNNTTTRFRFNLGPGLANCETFTHLIYGINSTTAPTKPADYVCDPLNNELAITIGTTDRNYDIYFWAVDARGLRSAISSRYRVNLKRAAPVLTTTSNLASVKGGNSVTITANADSASRIKSAEWEYSENGGPFSSLTTQTLNLVTSTSLAVTSGVIDGYITVRVRAEDQAGNISAWRSISVNVDSTAPSSLTLSRTSAAETKNTTVSLGISQCSGDATQYLIQESATPPTGNESAWVACSSSTTYALSSNNGLRTLWAFAKDAVGNVSAASNSVSLVLDTVAPLVNSVAINGGATATTSENLTVQVDLTDLSATLKVFIAEALGSGQCSSARSFARSFNWTNAGTGLNFTTTSTFGEKWLCVWAQDVAENESSAQEVMIVLEDPLAPASLGGVYTLSRSVNSFAVDPKTEDVAIVDYRNGGGLYLVNASTAQKVQLAQQEWYQVDEKEQGSIRKANLREASPSFDGNGRLYFADIQVNEEKAIYQVDLRTQNTRLVMREKTQRSPIAFAANAQNLYTLRVCGEGQYEVVTTSSGVLWTQPYLACNREIAKLFGGAKLQPSKTQLWLTDEGKIYISSEQRVVEVSTQGVFEVRPLQDLTAFTSGKKTSAQGEKFLYARHSRQNAIEAFSLNGGQVVFKGRRAMPQGFQGMSAGPRHLYVSLLSKDQRFFKIYRLSDGKMEELRHRR